MSDVKTADTSAILVCAGNASRMGGIDKIAMPLGASSVVGHSMMALEACPDIAEIIVVTRPDLFETVRETAAACGITKLREVCAGGATRQESVIAGLRLTDKATQYIAIHDGAEGDTDVTRIRAAVRSGYAGIPLQTLLAEEAKGYRNILKDEAGPDWFALTAEDVQGNYVYIRYTLRGDRANVLTITAPREQKASFDMAASSVAQSFKPGFGR